MQVIGATVLLSIMGLTVALDNNTYQLLSSALQIFTIIYLNRVDARQRHDIAPKLEQVTSALDTRVMGGRREHDPNPIAPTTPTPPTGHHTIP